MRLLTRLALWFSTMVHGNSSISFSPHTDRTDQQTHQWVVAWTAALPRTVADKYFSRSVSEKSVKGRWAGCELGNMAQNDNTWEI